MSILGLYGALHERLVADTGVGSLVNLTGHTESSPRILRERPRVSDRTPVLTFCCDTTTPLVRSADAPLFETMVVFGIYAKEEVKCLQIADRLTALFISGTMWSSAANSGLDISNLSIVNASTRLRSREELVFSDEYEVWETLVRSQFRWYGI